MSKESITIRLQPELIERLKGEAEEAGVSRSEYIRQILRERHERDELRDEIGQLNIVIDTLRDRLDSREERIEQLEEQLAKRSQIEEKVDTLAKQQDEPEPPFFVKWARWFRDRE